MSAIFFIYVYYICLYLFKYFIRIVYIKIKKPKFKTVIIFLSYKYV